MIKTITIRYEVDNFTDESAVHYVHCIIKDGKTARVNGRRAYPTRCDLPSGRDVVFTRNTGKGNEVFIVKRARKLIPE